MLVSSLWFLKTQHKSGNQSFYCSWLGEDGKNNSPAWCVCVCLCVQGYWPFTVSLGAFPWSCSQLDEASSLGDTHVLHEGLGLLLGDLAKPRLSKPVGEHVTSCWGWGGLAAHRVTAPAGKPHLNHSHGLVLPPPDHTDTIFVAAFSAYILFLLIFIISTTIGWKPKHLTRCKGLRSQVANENLCHMMIEWVFGTGGVLEEFGANPANWCAQGLIHTHLCCCSGGSNSCLWQDKSAGVASRQHLGLVESAWPEPLMQKSTYPCLNHMKRHA